MQGGWTPLHLAAGRGHEAAIKALVAAKAPVHDEGNVRGGGGHWVCMAQDVHLNIVVSSFKLRLLKDRICGHQTQRYTLECTQP